VIAVLVEAARAIHRHEAAVRVKDIDRPPITEDQPDVNHPDRRAAGELGHWLLVR